MSLSQPSAYDERQLAGIYDATIVAKAEAANDMRHQEHYVIAPKSVCWGMGTTIVCLCCTCIRKIELSERGLRPQEHYEHWFT